MTAATNQPEDANHSSSGHRRHVSRDDIAARGDKAGNTSDEWPCLDAYGEE